MAGYAAMERLTRLANPFFNVPMIHAETELIHIGLHVLYGDMINPVHTYLHNRPKGFNSVGVLAVSFGKLHIVIHHDPDEILGTFGPAYVNHIVPAVLIGHNRSSFLAGIIQHL